MRLKHFFIFVFCLVSLDLYAQASKDEYILYPSSENLLETVIFEQSSPTDEPVYPEYNVGIKPEFLGDKSSLSELLGVALSLKPAQTREHNHTILFTLLIKPDSSYSIQDIQIIAFQSSKSEAKMMYEKVKNFLEVAHNWKPAEKNGNKVATLVTKEYFFSPKQS